ncbi:copper resistance CopC family protein [Nonomuraea sp. NPDC050786]|uniref:copper resistance CopC family protein n=1 Tax=Nonomuraea sp. NPDC050786 TaxID=3154840 RepID=UPI00340AA4CC
MRRLLTVLLLAFATAWVAAPAAQAHNVLVGSDPKDGATLSAAPSTVTLVFDQAVRQGYAQVGVTGADGSSWADGAAVVAAERVSVRVRPLPAGGSYVVGYRILSSDGHPVTGKITFTLSPGAAGAPAAAATGQAAQGTSAEAAEAAANGGAGMAVVWVVGALLVLAAGTAVALRRSGPSAAPAAQPASDPHLTQDPGSASDPQGPQPASDPRLTEDAESGPSPEVSQPDSSPQPPERREAAAGSRPEGTGEGVRA